jgi:hypothetical protein
MTIENKNIQEGPYDETSSEIEENESEDEDELPSLANIFGYENNDDNEEAALDHILKIQENGE